MSKMRDEKKPFQKISEACETTGLSQYFLRRGCRDGTVPHVRSGRTYLVNVPALLRQLGASSGNQGDGQRYARGD